MPRMDHPVWCVNRAELLRQEGYTHFHWLGAPNMEMGLQMGKEYAGYLMKLTARETFYLMHHGMPRLVTPGIDDSSHANIVTDCE